MSGMKRSISFFLICCLILIQSAVAAKEAVISDIAGTPYQQAVERLYNLGIVDGYKDKTFRSLEPVSRCEVSKLIINLLSKKHMVGLATGETPFSDVSQNHWATGYINLTNQLGMMKGNGDATFLPENTITFQELIKVLVTVLGYEKNAVEQGGYPDGYMQVAKNTGLTKNITANNTNPLNRGTVALLLSDALDIELAEGADESYYGIAEGKTLASHLETGMIEYSTNGYYASQGSVSKSAAMPSMVPMPTGTPSPTVGYGSTGGAVMRYPSEEYALPPVNHNTEEYSAEEENRFLSALSSPLSTFSIDVDTASFSNVRRMIQGGSLPVRDAVRIEEMINYFHYDYPKPENGTPFSIYTELAACPWNKDNQLIMVSLKGKELEMSSLPPNNFVFLIDVSGSMGSNNKLSLLKKSMMMLTDQLRPQDKISIVVYASTTGIYLDSISGAEKATIKAAIANLKSGGSTAGASGIRLAYGVAKKNYIHEGNNRIILGTDGDFNVGASSESELLKLIEENRDQGVYLSVLGFGMGNIKDNKMELLADKGNGNYAYIDSEQEAKKVLVQQAGATLFTIAKDVKLQVEFNPGIIVEYRLIGYENRKLNNEDFNDDKKDVGELGAGHVVTAFYEIVMTNSEKTGINVDSLKYQTPQVVASEEVMTVKFRYKEPSDTESKLLTQSMLASDLRTTPSDNFMFASAVAEFGLLLKNSAHKGSAGYDNMINRATASVGQDPDGYRAGFVKLAGLAKELTIMNKQE